MPAHDAIRGEILRLADRHLDRYDFAREGARVLRRAVPFDAIAGVWFDPDTGLPVDEWSENSLADRAHHDTEITAFRVLAASGRRAAGRWAMSSGPCTSATQACGAGSCCIANAELSTSRGGRWT